MKTYKIATKDGPPVKAICKKEFEWKKKGGLTNGKNKFRNTQGTE